MFKFTVLAAAALATTSAVSAAMINTPTAVVQCQPVQISWTNAQGQVYVSVLPNKEVSAAPLVSFAPQAAGTTSLIWVPNLPAGQVITLSVSDSTGTVNYSDTATVRAGSDTSCLNSGSAAAAGSADTTGSGSSSSGSSGSSSSSASSPSSSTSAASSAQSSSGSSSGATSFRADTAALVGSGLVAVAAAVFA